MRIINLNNLILYCSISFVLCSALACLEELEQITILEVSIQSIDEAELNRNFITTSVKGSVEGLLEKKDIIDNHGFVWSIGNSNPLPSLEDNQGQHLLGAKAENGEFESNITDLDPEEEFTIRAFAIFAGEPIYSLPVSFNTPTPGFKVEAQKVEGYTLTASGPKIDVVTQITGFGEEGITIKQGGIIWNEGKPPSSQEGETLLVGSIPIKLGKTEFVNTINGLTPGASYYIIPFIQVGETRLEGPMIEYILEDIWVRKADRLGGHNTYSTSFSWLNKGHIIGGGLIQNSPDHLVFDPATNSWSILCKHDFLKRLGANSFVLDGKAYFLNGFGGPENKKIYQFTPAPATEKWIELDDETPMDFTNRWEAWSFVLGNKAYIGGGRDAQGQTLADFWSYSLESGLTIEPDGPGDAPIARSGAGSFTIDDTAYLGPGSDNNNSFTHDFWAFKDGVWSKKSDPPIVFFRYYVAFAINGKGYFVLGARRVNDTSSQTKELWEYDPEKDNWTRRADFPGLGRTNAIGFVANGRAYIGTGFTSQHAKDFWEYIPKTK